MNTKELGKLRKLAKAATKGNWIAVGYWVENERDDLKDICDCAPNGNEEGGSVVADAQYIAAAQPSTVLWLIEEIEYRTRKAQEHHDGAMGAIEELERVTRQRDELMAALAAMVNEPQDINKPSYQMAITALEKLENAEEEP